MKKRCELSVGCVLLLRIELHAIRGAAIAKNREKSTCIRITDTLKTNKTKSQITNRTKPDTDKNTHGSNQSQELQTL